MFFRITDCDWHSNDAVREFIQSRLARKLSRMSNVVDSTAVSIRDVNGPRGGVDHVVQIVVQLKAGETIVVRHRASDSYSGATAAIERAVHAVKRKQGRRWKVRRQAYRRSAIDEVRSRGDDHEDLAGDSSSYGFFGELAARPGTGQESGAGL